MIHKSLRCNVKRVLERCIGTTLLPLRKTAVCAQENSVRRLMLWCELAAAWDSGIRCGYPRVGASCLRSVPASVPGRQQALPQALGNCHSCGRLGQSSWLLVAPRPSLAVGWNKLTDEGSLSLSLFSSHFFFCHPVVPVNK